MGQYELIIFDLDGTLLDTSPGIFNSVRYAESQMKLLPIPAARLSEFVGPPPKSMYMKVYGLDEDQALLAAQKHREYGRTKAIYDAGIYPGIPELLSQLKAKGYKLAVATLKSQQIAEVILEHYGLHRYFDAIVGMDPQETLTKCRTIQLAVQHTGTCGKVLLVGDSQYDWIGAQEADIDFVGALYGFGFGRDGQYPFRTVTAPLQIEQIVEGVR